MIAGAFIATKNLYCFAHESGANRSVSQLFGCADVESLSKYAMSRPGIRRRSTLTFITTGDTSNAFEALFVGSYAFPISNRALDGRSAALRRQEQFVEEISKACSGLDLAGRSAIVGALDVAVRHLRSIRHRGTRSLNQWASN